MTISVAIVGREYSAALRMGELNPTDSEDSNGRNFDATRDRACRIESNSGRVHYVNHCTVADDTLP